MDGVGVKAFTIGIAGGRMTGKTSLCSRLIDCNPENDYIATIGVEFKYKYFVRNKVKLYFWDLGGGECFDNLTLGYVKKVDILVFVYNINNYDSISRMKRLHNFYKYSGVKNIPTIIVGTHIDSKKYFSNFGKDFTDFAKDFALINKYPHYEVSNKTGENIIEIQNKLLEISMSLQKQEKNTTDNSDRYENLSCNKIFYYFIKNILRIHCD